MTCILPKGNRNTALDCEEPIRILFIASTRTLDALPERRAPFYSWLA